MSKEIVDAIRALESEKGVSSGKLMEALEDALLSAYKKTSGAAKFAKVELDRESGDFRVFELLVPQEIEDKLFEEAVIKAEEEADTQAGEKHQVAEVEIDLKRLDDYSDQIERNDVTPSNFGRIAAQTAKQVVFQRIREAERDMMFEEYHDRVGSLVTGLIQQSDSRYTLVQLRERVEALLPKSEQVKNERYTHGMRIKTIISEVSDSAKGPGIIVSRSSPDLVRKLFDLEVPEVADGLVEITNVAREAGYRSKISVISHTDGVDPVGACVGPRGSRVRMVVSELRGEKIDIIPHNDEPARFVAKALSPARVREVLVNDSEMQATVIVPDDQLSLAIGKEGLNARLAARLTGWRIDIKSETEFGEEDHDMDVEDETEDATGRCRAVLASGKRCPNASVPGSRYCGLPVHQELDKKESAKADDTPSEDEATEVEDSPETEGDSTHGKAAGDQPEAEEPSPVAGDEEEEGAPDPIEDPAAADNDVESDTESTDNGPGRDSEKDAEAGTDISTAAQEAVENDDAIDPPKAAGAKEGE